MLNELLHNLIYQKMKEYFGMEVITKDEVLFMEHIPGDGYPIFSYKKGNIVYSVMVKTNFANTGPMYEVIEIQAQKWITG